MRRKLNALVPFEKSILDVAQSLKGQGINKFYGFQISGLLEDKAEAGLITHGTLYRALKRLRDMELLESFWEDNVPADQHRPRRRYYRLKG